MLTWLRRLASLGISERAISRQTGIPRSTLYSYRTGLFKPPAERTTIVHNYTRKVQYRHLRESGASTITANRFKNASLVRIEEVRTWHNDMTKYIADVYGKDEDSIRFGLSRTKRSVEDIESLY